MIPSNDIVTQMIELGENIKERRRLLDDVLRDEYAHFEWDKVPMGTYIDNDEAINIMITSLYTNDIKKAWRDLRIYITKNYMLKTKRYVIDSDITKATIMKFIYKTVYGERVQELGLDGKTTRNNVENGFISASALKVILKAMSYPYHETVKEAFQSDKKIEFIHGKLNSLQEKRHGKGS